MSERMRIACPYEASLFAGRMDEVGAAFTDDVTYWAAGDPPIGGEWHGKKAVLRAMPNREPGLGVADWGYEDVCREWYEADERIIVEIRERSWLRSAPEDVMNQRTCVVLRFRGDRICELRDYTDAGIYERFLSDLPKFTPR